MKISTAILVCSLVSVTPASVMGTTISQWTFETSLPATAGPYVAELGVSPGSALGFHAGTATYSSPLGNGSSHSFSANTWAVNDYWQFSVSTLNYQNIVVSWDQVSSPTGPGTFELFWSTDDSSFTPLGSDYSVLGTSSTWSASLWHQGYSFTNDLSSIVNLNNDSRVYFRLTDVASTNPTNGVVGTSGTDRIDNFTVTGDQIPANVPDSAPGLAGLGCALGLLAVLRQMTRAANPLTQRHA